MSLPAFAELCGRSYAGVWYHASKGRLEGAYDGASVDTEHPAALAFRALKPQHKTQLVEWAFVACDECGTLCKRHPGDIERRPRHFCSRACFSKARTRPAVCERCGRTFSVRDSRAIYCSMDCASVGMRIDQETWLAFGVAFSMVELVKASGLTGKLIRDRVRAGEHIEQAIMRPRDKPGPRKGKEK